MSCNHLQTHSDKLSLFLFTRSETECHKATAAKSLFSLFSCPTCLVCLKNHEKSDRRIQEHSSNILVLLYFFYDADVISFALPSIVAVKLTFVYGGSSVSTRVGWASTSYVMEMEKKDGTLAYEQCSKVRTISENDYVLVWERKVVPSGWTAPFDYHNQSLSTMLFKLYRQLWSVLLLSNEHLKVYCSSSQHGPVWYSWKR